MLADSAELEGRGAVVQDATAEAAPTAEAESAYEPALQQGEAQIVRGDVRSE